MSEIFDISYTILKGYNDEIFKPRRMSSGDIGYDLSAGCQARFNRGESHVIPLGVAFGIPDDMYGELTHRSSLAFKKDMICSLGVIDSSFNGNEVKAKIFNLSNTYQVIDKGDRIVQIIFKKKLPTEMWWTSHISSKKSKAGFGSSGVK